MIEVGEGWVSGSADDDAQDTRGWFLGPYVDDDPLLASHAVQVKWARHSDGEGRAEVAASDSTTSTCILVAGRMALKFGPDVVWLEKPGQFVTWRGVAHSWVADGPDETVTITVRWVEPPAVDERGNCA